MQRNDVFGKLPNFIFFFGFVCCGEATKMRQIGGNLSYLSQKEGVISSEVDLRKACGDLEVWGEFCNFVAKIK